MTPTPNPQPPLVISEEAREAAKTMSVMLSSKFTSAEFLMELLPEAIQLAINQATEKLTKENEELKADNERMFIVCHEYSKATEGRIQTLTTRIKELEAEVERLNPLLEPKKQARLPDPVGKQITCVHDLWQRTKPRPRSCQECGLQMWDAGD
jgi:hypothetical protein